MDDALTIVPFASTTVAATTLSKVMPHSRLVKPYLPVMSEIGNDIDNDLVVPTPQRLHDHQYQQGGILHEG